MKWLPIKNYEELYEISDTGEVRSVNRILKVTNRKDTLFRGRLIKQSPNKSVLYMQVGLWKENKKMNYYVHRLVAETFIPNPDNLPEVNHIDGNRQNNHIENLEWVSRVGNVQHAINTGLKIYTNRLTEEEFLECIERVINGETYTDLLKSVPYKLPFLSTKLKQVAKKYGLEDKLAEAVKLNQAKVKNQSSKLIAQTQSKRIAMLDPITKAVLKEFNSLREAHLFIGKSSNGSISNAANGKQKTAGGYSWKYL